MTRIPRGPWRAVLAAHAPQAYAQACAPAGRPLPGLRNRWSQPMLTGPQCLEVPTHNLDT